MIKINKNQAGFTLVELLAAMVILALLTAIAVPNVLKVLNKSRAETYVNDAQRLISTAENQYKKDTKITKLKNNGECLIMGLSYLDNGTFDDAPYGNSYDKDRSFVLIEKVSNDYIYYVRLLEGLDEKTVRGVAFSTVEQLVEKDAYSDYVTNKYVNPDINSDTFMVKTANVFEKLRDNNLKVVLKSSKFTCSNLIHVYY